MAAVCQCVTSPPVLCDLTEALSHEALMLKVMESLKRARLRRSPSLWKVWNILPFEFSISTEMRES